MLNGSQLLVNRDGATCVTGKLPYVSVLRLFLRLREWLVCLDGSDCFVSDLFYRSGEIVISLLSCKIVINLTCLLRSYQRNTAARLKII